MYRFQWQFAYDNSGNRLNRHDPLNNPLQIAYNPQNLPTTVTDGNGHTTTMTYDANGNLTNARADTYSWDWANHLVNAIVGGNTASYNYDGLGVRTGATLNGTTSNYLWDRLAQQPQLVDDGSHAYLHAFGPQAQIDAGGNRQALLTDALGSVRGVTDDSGALVGTADYTVFGGVRTQSGQSSAFGFTGELFTPQTNLLHLRARDLNPSLGRFLSADSVQPNAPGTQGFNLYAYVANNPTTWVDHSGHSASETSVAHDTPMSHGQAAVVAGLIASLPALVVAGTLGGLALGIASVFLLMACVLYDDCLAMVGDAAATIGEYGSTASGAPVWSADQLSQAPASYPFLPSAPTPTIPALPPWWAATPTPGTYLSAGPTNTPTPGTYFTSPLLPFPTSTSVPSGSTNWPGTVMYPALQYIAVDAPEAQWGWSWASKLLGHSAGAFPKAPVVIGGALLTLGPNAIYNYNHGGLTNPELWEDLTVDSTGFLLTYYAGVYVPMLVYGGEVGAVAGPPGILAGAVAGIAIGFVWDNYGGPMFEQNAVDPFSSWIRG